MRLLNSSAVVRRPSVRMLSSVLNPSMRPLGSSTFSRLSALRTSTGVTLKPAIFTGSSSSFILYFLSPHTLIALTPAIVCKRSLKTSLAIWESSSRLR